MPLREGDPALLNVYHAYVVNPGKRPTVHRAEAQRFVQFLTESATQAWIGEFGRAEFGQRLFVPDARQNASAGPREASDARAVPGRR